MCQYSCGIALSYYAVKLNPPRREVKFHRSVKYERTFCVCGSNTFSNYCLHCYYEDSSIADAAVKLVLRAEVFTRCVNTIGLLYS